MNQRLDQGMINNTCVQPFVIFYIIFTPSILQEKNIKRLSAYSVVRI